ncbi:MAG: CDP-glycerol glycerophosphotransferase family protein, partial [Acidobacteria bacterium]|nr:CDP-glycerol glycerophosphotransferase family protein [Acidobacteriota bacterium]
MNDCVCENSNGTPARVLFTGYAGVHFACFLPLYELLRGNEQFEVYVSGGLRTKIDGVHHYDLHGMYDQFDIPADRRMTVEQIHDEAFDYLFASNTKMIAPREVGTRVQIFHGVSFRNKAVREDNAHADAYFVIGPYMQRAFSKAGIIREDDPRALPMGFMKTDRLLNGQLDRSALLDRYGFNGDRPVVLYAPTGQKHNSLETMGEAVLRSLTESDRFDIIVKPHDHPKNKSIDWFARLGPMESNHLRVTRDADVIPLLFLADLLITDASSVSSEYSLLDRPMVFLDVPKLLSKAGKHEGSMLDLETWGRRCGDIVRDPDDALGVVCAALDKPERHASIRQAMAEDLFFNRGCATESALQWL